MRFSKIINIPLIASKQDFRNRNRVHGENHESPKKKHKSPKKPIYLHKKALNFIIKKTRLPKIISHKECLTFHTLCIYFTSLENLKTATQKSFKID